MPSGLTAARVRQDIDVVARAGLDLDNFLAESVESISRAVPWVAACIATHDPSTHLLTSARKYGHLRDRNTHDHEFGIIEYGTVEPTAFTELAAADSPAAGVHLVTEGDIERSGRMGNFMKPHFAFADEARLVFRDGRQVWGALALFRGGDDRPFDQREVDFLASLSSPFAQGVRTGVLSRLIDAPPPPAVRGGPAVVVVGADDEIVSMSLDAEARLSELVEGEAAGDPVTPVSSLVGAARRYARGETTVPPRSRVRTRSGMWLVLHAGPLLSRDGRQGDVVITIEEARPPEIVGLVVAAFGLTARERDVTQLVLQGVDTKEVAATLHLSTYTVQDHLKAVFEKAGVRSRRELIARIYFDQYVPRMGAELGPSGWFA
ncbi:helix-turn-helix transcriptional regulator [Nocardioides bizhenqiangii]|uniref:Helix-turn-helix transcriptional regulator n=1 Tax=Nocardioides bizhenqiangii TaxID=3095076 RepID=A0ABZ0ZLV8_9ACTN|nr:MULTISPECIES: helix-turn-helix transcriptional regulator [unclassified Nocardioides]MDZ5620889.1 helix-turn-helix transcriptional regulator [Nocardioides sp. HM23]WQQ25250.1 helix-turn-helix transcriptional regulator [Nocardioides sp. HM61]